MITLALALLIVVASLAADMSGAILQRIRPPGNVQRVPISSRETRSRTPAAEPERMEPDARRQALNNIAYCDEQLSRLYELMDCAKLDLIAARHAVQVDADADRYGGGVISGKAAAKHRADLDRALRRVIVLESRIHSMETAREKNVGKIQ